MGLHHITQDGDAVWHCAGRDCDHHNCADPLDDHGTQIGCEHHRHLPQDQRPAGPPLTAHISHEAVQWTRGGTLIALPECPCGTQLFAKCVFTDEELAAPNLTIPEYEEYQESILDKDEERLRLALLKHGIEIDQVVHIVKQRRIVGEHRHPMIDRHIELARQLIAIGKAPTKVVPNEESQGKIEEEALQPKTTKRRKKGS